MALETNFKVKVVKWYFENAKSIVKTQWAFKRSYNTKKKLDYVHSQEDEHEWLCW